MNNTSLPKEVLFMALGYTKDRSKFEIGDIPKKECLKLAKKHWTKQCTGIAQWPTIPYKI